MPDRGLFVDEDDDGRTSPFTKRKRSSEGIPGGPDFKRRASVSYAGTTNSYRGQSTTSGGSRGRDMGYSGRRSRSPERLPRRSTERGRRTPSPRSRSRSRDRRHTSRERSSGHRRSSIRSEDIQESRSERQARTSRETREEEARRYLDASNGRRTTAFRPDYDRRDARDREYDGPNGLARSSSSTSVTGSEFRNPTTRLPPTGPRGLTESATSASDGTVESNIVKYLTTFVSDIAKYTSTQIKADAAKASLKIRTAEIEKSRMHHEAFPSVQEQQTLAHDNAKKVAEEFDRQLKEQQDHVEGTIKDITRSLIQSKGSEVNIACEEKVLKLEVDFEKVRSDVEKSMAMPKQGMVVDASLQKRLLVLENNIQTVIDTSRNTLKQQYDHIKSSMKQDVERMHDEAAKAGTPKQVSASLLDPGISNRVQQIELDLKANTQTMRQEFTTYYEKLNQKFDETYAKLKSDNSKPAQSDVEFSELKKEVTETHAKLDNALLQMNDIPRQYAAWTKELEKEHKKISSKVLMNEGKMEKSIADITASISQHNLPWPSELQDLRKASASIPDLKSKFADLAILVQEASDQGQALQKDLQDIKNSYISIPTLSVQVDDIRKQVSDSTMAQTTTTEEIQKLNMLADTLSQVHTEIASLRDGVHSIETDVRQFSVQAVSQERRVSALESRTVTRATTGNAATMPEQGATLSQDFSICARLDDVELKIKELRASQSTGDQLYGQEINTLNEETEKLKVSSEAFRLNIENLSTHINTQFQILKSDSDETKSRVNSTIDSLYLKNSEAYQELAARIESYGASKSASLSRPDSVALPPEPQIPELQRASKAELDDFMERVNHNFHALRRDVFETFQGEIQGLQGVCRALDSRYNNITTEALAKHMLSQLEAIYPNNRNLEQQITSILATQQEHKQTLAAQRQDHFLVNQHFEQARNNINDLGVRVQNLERYKEENPGLPPAARREITALCEQVDSLRNQCDHISEELTSTREDLRDAEAHLNDVDQATTNTDKTLIENLAATSSRVDILESDVEEMRKTAKSNAASNHPAPAVPVSRDHGNKPASASGPTKRTSVGRKKTRAAKAKGPVANGSVHRRTRRLEKDHDPNQSVEGTEGDDDDDDDDEYMEIGSSD